ncbi:MAG: lipopolysaccharide biosynthesis protein [Paludibacteraceae bacterium]
MKEQIRKIARSELVRNSAKLLSANVIAQAIGLLVYPILTRLYSPEDFGLLNLFLSIGGVLVLLSTAEYQYAIVLPKKDEEARGLVHICGFLLLITTGIVLLSVPFSKPIARLFNTPELANWYWLMPLFVFVMGLWNILNYWYIRRKQFGAISRYQISQSVLSATSKSGIGYVGCTTWGLIVCSVFAPVLSLIANILSYKKQFSPLLVRTSKDERQQLIKAYKNFPLYTLPRSFINNLSSNLPSLLLTPFFGLGCLGYFGMACTIALRPITIVTGTLYQILYERVARQVREQVSIWRIICKTYLPLSCLVIPCMVGLWFGMPTLVKWFLGADWIETARYIRYMLPWFTCIFIVAPLAFISDIFGKQRTFLIIECVYFLLRVLAMGIGIYLQDFDIAIILLSASGTVILIIQLLCYLHFIHQYESTREVL